MQYASSGAIQMKGGLAGANTKQGFSSASPGMMLANPDLQIAQQYEELGKALKLKGDYNGAIIEMMKALEIRRRVVGKEHPDTASSYYQLGICHCQARNYDQALTV